MRAIRTALRKGAEARRELYAETGGVPDSYSMEEQNEFPSIQSYEGKISDDQSMSRRRVCRPIRLSGKILRPLPGPSPAERPVSSKGLNQKDVEMKGSLRSQTSTSTVPKCAALEAEKASTSYVA